MLSGNRNFEARIHPNLKANFLASPPLVVAYAIAGTVLRDLMTEPVGKGKGGKDVYLGDIWPTSDEIDALMKFAMNGKAFRANYDKVKSEPGQAVGEDQGRAAARSTTGRRRTYIAEPPFFEGFDDAAAARREPASQGARVMALFGDSITTDHISPAGSIKETLAGRPVAAWSNGVHQGRLQQLRLAPRQPRGDDARHLRQRAHQEPDDPGRAPTARARKAA